MSIRDYYLLPVRKSCRNFADKAFADLNVQKRVSPAFDTESEINRNYTEKVRSDLNIQKRLLLKSLLTLMSKRDYHLLLDGEPCRNFVEVFADLYHVQLRLQLVQCLVIQTVAAL